MSQAELKQYPLAVAFTSRNVSKSITFYSNVLGFTLSESWPEKEPLWANLVLDKQSIMIGASMTAEASQQMGCSGAEAEAMGKDAETFAKNKAGVGVVVYVQVADVDSYHKQIVSKGAKPFTAPTTKFYGQKDFTVEDPDGYRLIFYTPIAMENCQSCGMPLKDAEPGQMFCQYCTDAQGKLKPYNEIFEGCINGYFIPMQKMTRPSGESG